MPRNPFDAHLCAEGPDAAALWERGFEDSVWFFERFRDLEVVRTTYELVRDSTDVGIDWRRAPVPYTPWGEGFMLGVYGLVALGRLRPDAELRSP